MNELHQFIDIQYTSNVYGGSVTGFIWSIPPICSCTD